MMSASRFLVANTMWKCRLKKVEDMASWALGLASFQDFQDTKGFHGEPVVIGPHDSRI